MRRFATVLVALVAAACAFTGAASMSAAAPLPYLVMDCTQDVYALGGQQVELSRLAVSDFVGDAIKATAKTLPDVTSVAGSTTFNLGQPIAVGTVGTVGAGQSITGSAIADAVVPAAASLPQFASNKDAGLAALRAAVTKGCGLTIHRLDGDDADGQGTTTGSTGQESSGSGVVGAGYQNPDQLWLYTPEKLTGRAAPHDYGDIPAATPGAWSPSPSARYGDQVPGYAPQFGLVGAPDDENLRTAGDAEALPVEHSADIGLPVLLAVLALSVVTGTLVRTWVLRRA